MVVIEKRKKKNKYTKKPPLRYKLPITVVTKLLLIVKCMLSCTLVFEDVNNAKIPVA